MAGVSKWMVNKYWAQRNSVNSRAHCKRKITPEMERFLLTLVHTAMMAASECGRRVHQSVLTWQVSKTLDSSSSSASHCVALGKSLPLLDCSRSSATPTELNSFSGNVSIS